MIFRMEKNLDRSRFRFVTMHAFDRRTDGRIEFLSLDRVCIPCMLGKSRITRCLLSHIWGKRKGVILSWWNFA